MITVDKIKEKYLSTILAITIIATNLFTGFSLKIDMATFMDKTISFSSISFGFLLAVLSLLLQSDTSGIKRIKDNGRFSELINFNKKAVIASAVLVFCALAYIGFKLSDQYNSCSREYTMSTRLIADTICLAIFIFQVAEVYLFLDLFYFLIKQKD